MTYTLFWLRIPLLLGLLAMVVFLGWALLRRGD
jgi:hypothetical protein